MPGPKKSRMRRCHDGKKRYESHAEATAAMLGMINRKRAKGDAVVTFLRVYGCACGGFHFGRTKEINWAAVT